ncbi:MAG: MBL fold metallo-hydrolase [Haloarculaceae archaeon]
MAIGDVYEASAVDPALSYVDTGMYDVPEYGSVYVIDAERPAIVDAGIGTNYERVLEAVERAGIDPADLEVIALTHVHLDHAGGAGFIAEATGAEVYVHEIGAPHLVDPGRLWEGTKRAVGDQIEYYVEPEPIAADRITELADGDAIDLGNRRLVAHHVPGHAPHQVAYEAPGMDAAFTGDAAGIFTPSTDRVQVTSPPPNFDLAQAVADTDTLAALDPSWLCYGHFGPAETADRLPEYADTLRQWVADVADARRDLGDDEAVVERFVESEETPDAWGRRKGRAEVRLNVRGVLTYLDRADDPPV